jgi:hypothetical protein
MDNNFSTEENIAKVAGKIGRQRHLKQYKDLSDDEFDQKMKQKALGINISEEFEKRIKKKLDEFDADYDLSDLKINDRDALRALIQAHLTLEDYEQDLFKMRSGGINDAYLLDSLDKFQKAMSLLRADISKFQDDLNIKRKTRKIDQDVSVQAYIDSLKDKAKRFYEAKMSFIFCEKCNILLGTVWTLYPNEEKNKIVLVCNRKLDDGTTCGHKNIVGTKELLELRGTNNKKITPESLL